MAFMGVFQLDKNFLGLTCKGRRKRERERDERGERGRKGKKRERE